jgi:hypothetical protein
MQSAKLPRRSVLAALLAVATAPAALAAATEYPASLLIYDSRWPQSLALRGRVAAQAIDMSHEHLSRCCGLRFRIPGGRIIGLTTWGDLVLARSLLQEQGRRLRRETQCGELFYWEMS